ncbi:hypothetical protein CHRYSEO8AT_560120 [Chryseobacterium sp. 8AT]|nr:hypothetical protein CHRYSEO8AT_560120 [Chryseobacterium sp. 8AT]
MGSEVLILFFILLLFTIFYSKKRAINIIDITSRKDSITVFGKQKFPCLKVILLSEQF